MFARFKAYINLKRRKDEPRAGAAAILIYGLYIFMGYRGEETTRRMSRETSQWRYLPLCPIRDGFPPLTSERGRRQQVSLYR
jgi:hypothetical protein